MFNITEKAKSQVAEYFDGKPVQPVRVFLNQGCGGSVLAMAVDEQKDTDEVYELDGIKYVVDKEFLEKAQPIDVDFNGNGFEVSSSLELEDGCSSCASGGTCG